MAEPLALCDNEDIQQQLLWLLSGHPTQLGVWLGFTNPNTALLLLFIVRIIFPSY